MISNPYTGFKSTPKQWSAAFLASELKALVQNCSIIEKESFDQMTKKEQENVIEQMIKYQVRFNKILESAL